MPTECVVVAVRVKEVLATLEKCTDPVQVIQKLKLPRWVLPGAGVVRGGPSCERGERFDLDVGLPPAGAETEAVAVA